MKETYIYPAVLTFGDDGISVEFPDLPGCLTCGENAEEAIDMARDALALHIWGLEDDGEDLPQPTPIKDLHLAKGQVAVLVDVWMPAIRDEMANKSVNKTLTLPKWLNDLAERRKVNFSQVLQSALKHYLGVESYDNTGKS